MKRIATVGLALMMTTSLIACGKQQPTKDIDDMTDSELESLSFIIFIKLC